MRTIICGTYLILRCNKNQPAVNQLGTQIGNNAESVLGSYIIVPIAYKFSEIIIDLPSSGMHRLKYDLDFIAHGLIRNGDQKTYGQTPKSNEIGFDRQKPRNRPLHYMKKATLNLPLV